jgi:hypothetical protein
MSSNPHGVSEIQSKSLPMLTVGNRGLSNALWAKVELTNCHLPAMFAIWLTWSACWGYSSIAHRHHCRHFYLNTRPHKHLIHTFNVHWMFVWPGMHVCDWAMSDLAVPNLTLRHHCTHFHLNTRPHNHLIHTFNVHWMFVWPGMQVVCKCVNGDIRFSSLESDIFIHRGILTCIPGFGAAQSVKTPDSVVSNLKIIYFPKA